MNAILQILSPVGMLRPRRPERHGEFNDIASYLGFAATERPLGRRSPRRHGAFPAKAHAMAALLALAILGASLLLLMFLAYPYLGATPVLEFRL